MAAATGYQSKSANATGASTWANAPWRKQASGDGYATGKGAGGSDTGIQEMEWEEPPRGNSVHPGEERGRATGRVKQEERPSSDLGHSRKGKKGQGARAHPPAPWVRVKAEPNAAQRGRWPQRTKRSTAWGTRELPVPAEIGGPDLATGTMVPLPARRLDFGRAGLVPVASREDSLDALVGVIPPPPAVGPPGPGENDTPTGTVAHAPGIPALDAILWYGL